MIVVVKPLDSMECRLNCYCSRLMDIPILMPVVDKHKFDIVHCSDRAKMFPDDNSSLVNCKNNAEMDERTMQEH